MIERKKEGVFVWAGRPESLSWPLRPFGRSTFSVRVTVRVLIHYIVLINHHHPKAYITHSTQAYFGVKRVIRPQKLKKKRRARSQILIPQKQVHQKMSKMWQLSTIITRACMLIMFVF